MTSRGNRELGSHNVDNYAPKVRIIFLVGGETLKGISMPMAVISLISYFNVPTPEGVGKLQLQISKIHS